MEKETLATIIKKTRELKGISQRKLAKLTKIDNAEISRIERGIRKHPNFLYLKNLSDVLEIDFIYLLKLANYDNEDIEDIQKMLKIDYESLPLYPTRMWTEEEYDNWLNTRESGIDLLKVIRGFKKGKLSEDDFIYLISKGLGINIENYFVDNKKD